MWKIKIIRAPRVDHVHGSTLTHQSWRQRHLFWFFILILLLALVCLQKFIDYFPSYQRSPRLPVVTQTAQTKNVPVYVSALGSVTPTYSVTVKSMINGIMLRVLFREGQMVKKGDLLAEIDPRPYEAQLVEYQGQLQRDQALLANALIDLKRYQLLYKQDSVSEQTLATQKALVAQYAGAVKMDQGLLDTVRVNLIYCRITSPLDGRIGLRLVDPGNFVQTSDTTGIAVINTLNPITVIFTVAEDYIPQILQQIDKGKPLLVKAYDRTQQILLATGTLLTIDNQVDPSTGTVKLRAEFANENNRLFPSQFVNVQLLVNTLMQATIIPTAAIQYGAKNTYVYVLNKDNTVSIRSVTVGITMGDDTTVTGIAPGLSVVIDGADKLSDGAAVLATTTHPLATVAYHAMHFSPLLKTVNHLSRRLLA